jgi:site-specific DNA-methyltransferase (adenine-specific)
VELKDLQTFGEPGSIVYLTDCVELMKIIPPGSVDVIFADPPYRLSRGGVTVKNGRLAPEDKGAWDRSMGFGRRNEGAGEAAVSGGTFDGNAG